MDNKNIIACMQYLGTWVSNQSFNHFVQARIFAAQGFTKLEEKYAGHSVEELDFAKSCFDRILDLGGEIKHEERPCMELFDDIEAFYANEIKLAEAGLSEVLAKMPELACDLTTYDMVKEWYKDEEEDCVWTATQLELIKKIGRENYLSQQM